MKNMSIQLRLGIVLVSINEKISLVPSMVLSTFVSCVLMTFVPQLAPVYMAQISRSWT